MDYGAQIPEVGEEVLGILGRGREGPVVPACILKGYGCSVRESRARGIRMVLHQWCVATSSELMEVTSLLQHFTIEFWVNPRVSH